MNVIKKYIKSEYEFEVFDSFEKVLGRYAYVKIACRYAICQMCKKSKDLYSGGCFDCLQKVGGRAKKSEEGKINGHQVFEKNNPENSWIVSY